MHVVTICTYVHAWYCSHHMYIRTSMVHACSHYMYVHGAYMLPHACMDPLKTDHMVKSSLVNRPLTNHSTGCIASPALSHSVLVMSVIHPVLWLVRGWSTGHASLCHVPLRRGQLSACHVPACMCMHVIIHARQMLCDTHHNI